MSVPGIYEIIILQYLIPPYYLHILLQVYLGNIQSLVGFVEYAQPPGIMELTTTKVGIALGIIFLLAIVGFIILGILRRRRLQQEGKVIMRRRDEQRIIYRPNENVRPVVQLNPRMSDYSGKFYFCH